MKLNLRNGLKRVVVILLISMWLTSCSAIIVSHESVQSESVRSLVPESRTANMLGNPSIADMGLEEFTQTPDMRMAKRGYDYMLFQDPYTIPKRDVNSLMLSQENRFAGESEGGILITAPRWILDEKDRVFRPYLYEEVSSTEHLIATARIGARVLAKAVEFYDPEFEELLATESFKLQYRNRAQTWVDISIRFEGFETILLGDHDVEVVRLYSAGYPMRGSNNFRIGISANSHGLKHTILFRNSARQSYEFRVIQRWYNVKYADYSLPELNEEIHRIGFNRIHVDNVGPVMFYNGQELVMSEDPTDDSNPIMHKSSSTESIWIEGMPAIAENGTLIHTGHYETVTREFTEPSPFMEFFTSTSMDIRRTPRGSYEILFAYENPHNFTIACGETFTLDPMTSTYTPYDTNQNGWIYRRDDGYKAYNKGYYGSAYFPFGYYDPDPGETGYEYFYRSFEQFNVQGLPDDANVESVVLATYMQELSYDDDIDSQRLGLLREVLYDWGTLYPSDWGAAINTDWSITITHGECEKTQSGDYRRWASWWDWEGGGLCNLVESKRVSDYVRLRYSHVVDEYSSNPTSSEYNRFKKEYQRHRNGGPDPQHPNVLIVSYSVSEWDHTYDGTTKYADDQPYWLVFPRETFGWGVENVYDGEIGPTGDIFDIVEWGTYPGGGVYWGPHIIAPWPKRVSLGTSFLVEGDVWFDNGGTGTGANMLMLWDTNHKLMALLYIYDLWAYTDTYRVAGYIYDENGAGIRSVDIKPKEWQHVNWDGVSWHIRGDSVNLAMQFHDESEIIIGTTAEMGGSSREIGFFSYRIWQRGSYGVCTDPGGLDNIHFLTPTSENVLDDDGLTPYEWSSISSYSEEARYPAEDPSSGTLYVALEGSDYYYHCTNIPSGTGNHGPFFRRDLSTTFKLSSLYRFRVRLGRRLGSESSRGDLHVSLYDSRTHPLKIPYGGEDAVLEKPMIDIVLSDYSSASHGMNVYIRYFDEVLDCTEITLDSSIVQDWNGEFTIWFDVSAGLWVDYDMDALGPILLADWSKLNLDRIAGLVAIQPTRIESSPRPDFRVYDIQVEKCVSWDDSLFLTRGRELRSGPKNCLLTKPGPSNEIQVFPQDGDGKLRFLFYCYGISQSCTLTLDIRPIWLADADLLPSVNPTINNVPRTSVELTWDPVQLDPTANYLLQWAFNAHYGWNTIELDVRGPEWDPHDTVVLRGVWVYGIGSGCYTLHQQFRSGADYTLTYLVPMGPDSTLDLEWVGSQDSQITVRVDGAPLLSTILGPGLYLDLPLSTYSRNTLRFLDIVYLGDPGVNPWDSYLTIMHTHYFWMNIEIDYIEGSYPSVDFYVLRDYYESHTHLRLDFTMAPTGIPDLYDGNYSSAEIVRLGQVDGYFANRGNRWWFWCLYVPYLEGGASGWYINSDFADAQDIDPNGWNRWVSTVQKQFSQGTVQHTTSHEWGHVMHCHEGYDEWNCECLDCVYNTNFWANPWDIQICQYHWYETWENTPDHPYGVPLWSYDWWLE